MLSQLGGNAPFREFMKTYDAKSGGYKEGMNPYDTYHSWAASQYKSKVRRMFRRYESMRRPPCGYDTWSAVCLRVPVHSGNSLLSTCVADDMVDRRCLSGG